MLKIEGTIDTPTVIFDPLNNVFEISGRSYPEDTKEFYTPILEWVDKYKVEPQKETIINFKLDYFNSSSYKPLLDILMMMEKIKEKGSIVQTNWYYKNGDIDMKEVGEEFSELVDIPFSFHTF